MNSAFFLVLAGAVITQDTTLPTLPQAIAPAASALHQDKNILVIDPKARAADYIQAYDLLRRDKPSLKVIIKTSSETITNIQDLSASSHGTLLLVKVLSNQGSKYQILPIEEVEEIAYSP